MGHGHPLWFPDEPKGRNIHIGDVGWMKGGKFLPLFNTMQSKRGLPEVMKKDKKSPAGFKPLVEGEGLSIDKTETKIQERFIFSRHIQLSEVKGKITVKVPK